MSEISKTLHVTTHGLALVFPAHCGHVSSEWFQWRAAKARPQLLHSGSQKLDHRAAGFPLSSAVLMPPRSSTHVLCDPFAESHPEPEPFAL